MKKLSNRRGDEVLYLDRVDRGLYRYRVVTRNHSYMVTASGKYYLSDKESEFDIMGMLPEILVIFHKGCADGVGAAWCFQRILGKHATITFWEGVYGSPPPDVTGKDVYLVDFSYSPDVIKEMCKTARTVTLLDHHKSAIEALLIEVMPKNFDMSHSRIDMAGCEIAFNFLSPESSRMPRILQHVADRDMWQFNLASTKEVMAAFFAEPVTFDRFDKYADSVDELAVEGRLLLKQHADMCQQIIDTSSRLQWIGGYHVLSVNAPYMFASDIGNMLGEGAPFAATYYDTEKFRKYSLRSKPSGIDVSVIAKAYGGGGHKHAAGFVVSREHILART